MPNLMLLARNVQFPIAAARARFRYESVIQFCSNRHSSTESSMFKSSKSEKNEKVYEFRYYRIGAKDMGKFKELADQYLPHRVKRSKLVGFWVTELGALNHVLHIWEYDSLSHRKAVREDALADEQWRSFLSEANPIFQETDNWLCRATNGNFNTPWSDKEFYLLTSVQYAPAENMQYAKRMFKDQLGLKMKQPGFKASFVTLIGNSKKFFVLESSSNPDDFLTHPDCFDAADTSVDTKILTPLPWNQWREK